MEKRLDLVFWSFQHLLEVVLESCRYCNFVLCVWMELSPFC